MLTGSFRNGAYFGDIYLNSNGSDDVFYAKMDSDGNFLWAKNVGSFAYTVPGLPETGIGMKSGNDGSIFLYGMFFGTIDLEVATFTSTSSTGNLFIAKIDGNGNFIWAKHVKPGLTDYGHALVVDKEGNVYIAGTFANSFALENISYIGEGGWNKHIKTDHNVATFRIKWDTEGDIYIMGYYIKSIDFGNIQIENPYHNEFELQGYLANINSDGECVWVAHSIGEGHIMFWDIVITEDLIYAIGDLDFNNNSIGSFEFNEPGNGDKTHFITGIDRNGIFKWVDLVDVSPNSGSANLLALSSDGYNNVYIFGDIPINNTINFGDLNFSYSGTPNSDHRQAAFFVTKLESSPLGLNNELPISFLLYPNPTSSILNFESEVFISRISLSDVMGKTILTKTVNGVNTALDIESLKTGTYFLRIETEDGNVVTKKVIRR